MSIPKNKNNNKAKGRPSWHYMPMLAKTEYVKKPEFDWMQMAFFHQIKLDFNIYYADLGF
jgi:hypothetical protein